jgi:hypothetical protein
LYSAAGAGAYIPEVATACKIAKSHKIREEDMTIGVLFEFPGNTQSQYDDAAKKLTGGGGLKKLADWPAKGLLMHLAGPTQTGWRVVDVWESKADLMAFAAILMPIIKAAGFPDVQPQIFPAYNFVKA